MNITIVNSDMQYHIGLDILRSVQTEFVFQIQLTALWDMSRIYQNKKRCCLITERVVDQHLW